MLMCYVAAALACMKAKETSGVTAEEVHQHMISCATEDPFYTLVLLWLRLIDIVLMMCDSGKGEAGERGDYASFSAARALLTPFMTVTNAKHYTPTMLHEMTQYLLASDQHRLVMEELMMCAKTRHNKPQYRDLLVEETVGGARAIFGKVGSEIEPKLQARWNNRRKKCQMQHTQRTKQ